MLLKYVLLIPPIVLTLLSFLFLLITSFVLTIAFVLIVALIVIICYFLLAFCFRYRKEKRIYNKILARNPYPIENFVRECTLDYTQEQFEFIKKARFCIASLAQVPVENIYPQDSFNDTIFHLPFWNFFCFDDNRFIDLLISQTGVHFPPELLEKILLEEITNPDISPKDITVKDFILELLQTANP